MSQRRLRGDAGFTLPEVLMTVVMLGVIMVAISGALLVTIGPDAKTADRLAASHDGQLLALHLPTDLQSATPTLADTAPGSTLACTGTVGGMNVLRVGWTQAEPSTTTYAVSYRTEQEDGAWVLARYACTNGGAVSRTVVARDLTSGTAAVASINGTVVTMTVSVKVGVETRTFSVSGSRRTPENECRVASFTLAYASLAQGDPSGHLIDDVTGTVGLAGPCAAIPLKMVFTPSGTTQSVVFGGSGSSRTATITQNAYTWTVGDKLFQVQAVSGSILPPPDATLAVTPYVVPCVATVTATPNPTKLDAANHLQSPVNVTVTTTGPCTDLELAYKPTAAGVEQVIPLGAGPTYAATIPAAAATWEAGNPVLRVRSVSTGVEDGATTLTVKPWACEVTAVTASPNPVGHTGSKGTTRLASDVLVTVTTNGPCSAMKIKFDPRNDGNPQTKGLAESAPGSGIWTYTIPGTTTTGSVRWSTGDDHVLTPLQGTTTMAPTGTLHVS